MNAVPAETAPGAPARLGLRIGDVHWLVDLAEAGEIVPVPPLLPVPLTQDWFAGLANLRGQLLAVVDVARFAGAAGLVPDKDTRLLALTPRLQSNVALLVSRMLGLRVPGGMQPLAPAADAPAWTGASWRDEAGLVWQELRLARLLADERFQRIAR